MARLSRLRLFGALGFLLRSAALGFLGAPGWRELVVPLLVYTLLSALVSFRPPGFRPARLMPIFDVLAVYGLQAVSLPASPFPAGVAGWSLGIFVLLVLLAAMTLKPRLIYAVATLAFVCECLLQRAAGVSWGAVGASACVLSLAAAATVTLMRQTSGLVEHLAGAQRESQALADLLGAQLKASQMALSEATPPGAALAAPEVNAPAAPEASETDAAGLSILIVEDEVHLLSALERTFGARHRITTAGSGNEALAVFEKGERFDVILSDLVMHDGTGMELHEQLTALAPDQADRMLFWSGGAPGESARSFVAAMADRALKKGVPLAQVEASFHRIVGAQGRHR
ncbi:MAG TPA: response regulator [Myxococcales bacterium]|nr:response regulator [Myxococcales bacterium]